MWKKGQKLTKKNDKKLSRTLKKTRKNSEKIEYKKKLINGKFARKWQKNGQGKKAQERA